MNAIAPITRNPNTHSMAIGQALEFLAHGNPSVIYRIGTSWLCRPIGGDPHPFENIRASYAVPSAVQDMLLIDADYAADRAEHLRDLRRDEQMERGQ